MSARPALHIVRDIDANGELTNCPHCAAAYAEAEQWKQDLLAVKRQLKTALEDKDAKMRDDAAYPAALALFELWKTECRHPRAKLDSARTRLLIAAAKLYKNEIAQLRWVVFCGRDLAFVNDKGVRQDHIGLLFRDSEHIERYANNWYRHAKATGLDLETGGPS